jgi:hypothetical protein
MRITIARIGPTTAPATHALLPLVDVTGTGVDVEVDVEVVVEVSIEVDVGFVVEVVVEVAVSVSRYFMKESESSIVAGEERW